MQLVGMTGNLHSHLDMILAVAYLERLAYLSQCLPARSASHARLSLATIAEQVRLGTCKCVDVSMAAVLAVKTHVFGNDVCSYIGNRLGWPSVFNTR